MHPSSSSEMSLGTRIGAYQIVRKIGEGGMGAVYEAVHALIGRRAAIKVLLPAYSQSQEIVSRFFNEARAATAVADAGIVQIFDFGYHDDGAAYIVMEFLDGESLDGRLRRVHRMGVADAARITRQVAMALAAAHRRGIVHRDLKPENVFLVPDSEVIGGERAKVLDFGIAKLAGEDGGRGNTRTGSVIGTPEYMSPEQCRGAGSVPIDQRADVYALGCILFALITGRPPFLGEGTGDLIIAHVTEAPTPPSQLVTGLSPELDALVLRCLAKHPDARFQSMVELAQALAALSYGAPRTSSEIAAAAYATSYPTPAPTGAPATASSIAATITGAAAELAAVPARRPRRVGIVAAAAAGAIVLTIIGIVTFRGPARDRAATSIAAPAAADAMIPLAPRGTDAQPVDAAPAPIVTVDAAAPAVDAGAGSAATAPAVDAGAGSAATPPSPHHHHAKKTACPPDDLYCIP